MTAFDFSIVKECCQVMFDYTAVAEDEFNLKKGDVITIINKVCRLTGTILLLLFIQHTLCFLMKIFI